MSQSHGSPHAGYEFGQVRSKYKISTLVDVSPSGIISEFREGVQMPFVDDLNQIINNRETWNTSRNEQRNWETIIQCISIRAQPILLTKPLITEVTGIGSKGISWFVRNPLFLVSLHSRVGAYPLRARPRSSRPARTRP